MKAVIIIVMLGAQK